MDLQVFLPLKADLTLGNKSTVLAVPPALSHGSASSSMEVGRFVGSIVKQDRTNCLAVSETPAQYSACNISDLSPSDLVPENRTHRLKLVIPVTDRLHFLVLGITVEWRVTAKEEIRDDSDSPDIDRFTVSCLFEDLRLHTSVQTFRPSPCRRKEILTAM